MSNKIFSISIDGETMSNLVTPVRYRVYTKDARISPKGAECVIWNEVLQAIRLIPAQNQRLCFVGFK